MCLTPSNTTLSTHAHPLLPIQIRFCPVGTCHIHLRNAAAHKPPESGGRAGEGTWVTEGLHSWNKCSPGSEGLWHKGQWCFPRMRTVRLQKDSSLLHLFPPTEPPLSDQAQIWTITNYTECSCKDKQPPQQLKVPWSSILTWKLFLTHSCQEKTILHLFLCK